MYVYYFDKLYFITAYGFKRSKRCYRDESKEVEKSKLFQTPTKRKSDDRN